jgi:intracellular sulfur oxidation DsrE/DsrF family protein
VSDGQGRAVEGIEVVAEWVAVRNLTGRMIGQARTAEAVTNRLGEFRICGVPVDRHTITVTAGTGTEQAMTEVVLSLEEPVGGVSLRLGK